MKTKKRALCVVIGALLSTVCLNNIAEGADPTATICHAGEGTYGVTKTNVKIKDHTTNGKSDGDLHTTGSPAKKDYRGACIYNTSGYNVSTGYNAAGYNSAGYNKDGYNAQGYDAAGYNKEGKRSGSSVVTKPSLKDAQHYPDSDKHRGDSDSGHGTKSKQKITVCHVPKGNPANRHTIHVSFNAWKAHQKHNASPASGDSDQLGSCNAERKETITKLDPTTKKPVEKTTIINSDVITDVVTTSDEKVHVIKGCTGEARTNLLRKVQSFYQPITVSEKAIDDTPEAESIATGISQCLDNGDSSDSTKVGHPDSSKSDSGHHKGGSKGQGRDSVTDIKVGTTQSNGNPVTDSGKSDSGHIHHVTDSGTSDSGHKRGVKHVKIHRIKDCKNKSTTHAADSSTGHKGDSDKNVAKRTDGKHGITDSDKPNAVTGAAALNANNFHKLLKDADSSVDRAKAIKDPIHVTDSSLNDSGVWRKYKACAGGKGGDANKIDSGKVGKKKGDSGHRKHQEVKACTDAQRTELNDALADHKLETHLDTSSGDIIMTEAAFNDESIKTLAALCPAPVEPSPTSVSCETIDNPSILGATTTGSTTTAPVTGSNTNTVDMTITGGTVTSTADHPTSTTRKGSVYTTTGGEVTGGTISGGVTTGGATTGGTATGGTVTAGHITAGTSELGNVAGADLYAGDLVTGTVTGGTVTGAKVVGGTIVVPNGTPIIAGSTTGGTVSGAAIADGVTVTGRNVSGSDTVITGAFVFTTGSDAIAAIDPVVTPLVPASPLGYTGPITAPVYYTAEEARAGHAVGDVQTPEVLYDTTNGGAVNAYGAVKYPERPYTSDDNDAEICCVIGSVKTPAKTYTASDYNIKDNPVLYGQDGVDSPSKSHPAGSQKDKKVWGDEHYPGYAVGHVQEEVTYNTRNGGHEKIIGQMKPAVLYNSRNGGSSTAHIIGTVKEEAVLYTTAVAAINAGDLKTPAQHPEIPAKTAAGLPAIGAMAATSTPGATVTSGTVIGGTYAGGAITNCLLTNVGLYASGGNPEPTIDPIPAIPGTPGTPDVPGTSGFAPATSGSTSGGSGRVGWKEINEVE